MIKAYVSFWKNYVNFSGRTSRAGYWFAMLCNAIIAIILYGIMIAGAASESGGMIVAGYALLALYGLATLIPNIAIAVRRLHDIGKGGVWYLIQFVPCVGGIVFLVFMCLPAVAGANQYGEYGVDLV